jgi:hypothetical protein
LVGAELSLGLLGEESFDDRAQRAGAQEQCRRVFDDGGERGEHETRSKGGLPSTALNRVAPREIRSDAGPAAAPASRSGET